MASPNACHPPPPPPDAYEGDGDEPGGLQSVGAGGLGAGVLCVCVCDARAPEGLFREWPEVRSEARPATSPPPVGDTGEGAPDSGARGAVRHRRLWFEEPPICVRGPLGRSPRGLPQRAEKAPAAGAEPKRAPLALDLGAPRGEARSAVRPRAHRCCRSRASCAGPTSPCPCAATERWPTSRASATRGASRSGASGGGRFRRSSSSFVVIRRPRPPQSSPSSSFVVRHRHRRPSVVGRPSSSFVVVVIRIDPCAREKLRRPTPQTCSRPDLKPP